MANYAVTTFVRKGGLQAVVDALETQIETVDTTKTIRVFNVYHMGGEVFSGVLIYDT